MRLRFSNLLRGLLLGAILALISSKKSLAETNSWSLASPDGRCAIELMLSSAGDLSYAVRREAKLVLSKSPLGLAREDQQFVSSLTVDQVGMVESHREQYELFAGVAPHVDHQLNFRSLRFRNTNNALVVIELTASDEGVAFRYHFPDKSANVHVVNDEHTGFAVPKDARCWLQPYHAATPYAPAYEDFFFHVAPGDLPPRSRGKPVGWCFPALFELPNASTWMLLTESGNDASYCASHLGPDSAGGLYCIAFPLVDEGTKGHTNKFGPEPRFTLPWTMPWRVIVLGKTAGDIAMSTLVTDLAPPSRLADTGWIKPGRASWAWWSHPEGPATAELFNEFTDFAAKMGWEYTLFDAGWWKPGLEGIASHARAKGVAPLAWMHARDFYDAHTRTEKLDEMVNAAVQGVKVDFWCSDRQEAIAAMEALFEDAASRGLVVNLHGCTIPRGWQRTWPNFLTAEAVLGEESYFYESRYPEKAAELNTVLPFTRNVAGPMDITPVGCSPKKYRRLTTAAHELAAALIFTSGLIHYADTPEFFGSLPAEAVRVLRDAPARWDETRCLIGEPGRAVVFARRAGATWFIAGINGTAESRLVTLDLTAFTDFPKRLLIAEGSNASLQVAVSPVPDDPSWQHELPPRGGFILRLEK
jgi:alpha-glucosidase